MKYLKKYKIFEEDSKSQMDLFDSDVKNNLNNLYFQSVVSEELDLVKFFLKLGADVNTENAIDNAIFNRRIFEYLLSKGLDINQLYLNNYSVKNQLYTLETQKMLIDNNLENWLYNHKITFHHELKDDPKYSTVIDRYESAEKFGL